MEGLIYLGISFILFFYLWKTLGSQMLEKVKDYKNDCDDWMETKEFWVIFLITFFWFAAVPLIVAWKVLDYIYKKII